VNGKIGSGLAAEIERLVYPKADIQTGVMTC